MVIPLLVVTIIAIVLVLDLIKDTEFTAILALVIVIFSTIYGSQEYYFAVLTMLLKPMIYVVTRRNIVKTLGLRLAVVPHIPILMYLLAGITFGYIAQRIIMPLLDLWASRVLFISLIFLALYLTITPSLNTLSAPAILLSFNIDTLNKTLYRLSIFVGAIMTMYMVIEMRMYMIVPFISVLVLTYYRKKLGILKKYIVPIAFFTIVLALSLIIS